MIRRILFSFLFASIFVASIFAQVPNGDFEQWSGGQPDGWSTNNFVAGTITQTTDAHSGSSAVKGANVLFNTIVVPPLLVSGDIGLHGFGISQRYTNLTGYYKLTSVGNDLFDVVISMLKNGQVIGAGAEEFNAASTYTAFSVPINYATSDVPDSCWISFTIANNDTAHVGSVFYIDDLAMNNNATAVKDNIHPLTFKLQQNYPNPFNPTSAIDFEIPVRENVTLTIYNTLGEKIRTLIDGSRSAGHYRVTWDGRDLNGKNVSSGIYLYRIKAGYFVESKKMILLK